LFLPTLVLLVILGRCNSASAKRYLVAVTQIPADSNSRAGTGFDRKNLAFLPREWCDPGALHGNGAPKLTPALHREERARARVDHHRQLGAADPLERDNRPGCYVHVSSAGIRRGCEFLSLSASWMALDAIVDR